jgi:hypothetical protein
MSLDEIRLISKGGTNAVDVLYEKYKVPRNERMSIMIDPNVNDASYFFTLGGGKKGKIEVHKNPDGSTDIKVIGPDYLD